MALDALKFLVVEDDEVDRLTCCRFLKQSFGEGSDIRSAMSWDEAVAAIDAHEFEVFIVDQNLGGRTGLELIERYSATMQDPIFILLTGQEDRVIDLAATKAGASDYLIKADLSPARLERSIRFALSMSAQKRELIAITQALEVAKFGAQEESRKHLALAQELESMQNQLRTTLSRAEESERQYRHLAQHDVLTGLPNRMLFADRLDVAFANVKRQRNSAALMLCDLDRFKHINDTLGHQTGDYLLNEVAQRLKDCVRESDTVARFGGDEFAILLTNLEAQADAAHVAEKILNKLSEPYTLSDQEISSSISIGIATLNGTVTDLDELMYQADLALYRAKDSGRNQYRFFDIDLNIDAKRVGTIRRDLDTVLQGKNFYLEFQPKLDLRTGTLNGVEALARWRHSTLGQIPPAEFIPLAEASGQILTISDWIFGEASRMARQLKVLLGRNLPISVNLSPVQLKQGGLLALTEHLLETHKIDPCMLEMEVTETTAVENLSWASDQLRMLRDLGIKIAIDDFGTGYSSLALATKLPADQIKIDRSFVSGMLETTSDLAAVHATVSLAHSLGMTVVAEGVETRKQLDYLMGIDCNCAQGYFIGRPMSGSALSDFCQAWDAGSHAIQAQIVTHSASVTPQRANSDRAL